MDFFKVSNKIKELINSIVDDVLHNQIEGNYSYSFNTKYLEPYKKGCKQAYEMLYFKELFSHLENIKTNCIYWFEADSVEQCKDLVALLDDYRYTNNSFKDYRTVPAKAAKKYDTTNSNIIYLGIRRGNGKKSRQAHSNIAQRINQHLGYYHTDKTQGLQLSSYVYGKDFNLTLKVCPLEGLHDNYLNLVEKELALRVNPHCGRH